MKTELLSQEKNIVKIKLDIEADEFKKALNRTLNELSQQVNIPGFRKGKAPRNILEMRFGKEAIYHETLDKIVPNQIRQIIEDYDLEPLDVPSLDIKETIVEGQNVNCELTFEVRPEIELPEIENFEIEKVVTEVKDEDVDLFEKRIKFDVSEEKKVERPVQDSDVVGIELSVTVLNDDGTEAAEQPKTGVSPEIIDLADQTVRPQVRDALIGKNKGDEVTTEFNVEDNHYEKTLAGKKVRYNMKITGVSEHILPELNEDFYKKVFGPNTEIKDYDAFRAEIRRELEDEATLTNLNDLRGRASRMVIDNSKLEIPENLVKRQIETNRKNDEKWAENNKVSLNEAYGLDTEEGRKGYENLLKTRAENNLKDVLVMDELAKKYDVHVEKEDLDAEFERRAKSINVSKGFIAKFFYEREEELNKLTDSLRWDKIADSVIAKMKVTEVKELSKPEQKNQENQENQQ